MTPMTRPLWNFFSLMKYSSSTNVNVLKVGDSLNLSRVFTGSDIANYSKLTYDYNPVHFDVHQAENAGFKDVLVPGMLVASLFPRIIASHFPGAVYLKQTLDFKLPVFIGDSITGDVKVCNIRHIREKYMVKFLTTCHKDGDIMVISGEATTMLPTLAVQQLC